MSILIKLKGNACIINLEQVFQDMDTLWLVTELCSGGELYDQIVEKSCTSAGHFMEFEVRA